MLKLYSRFAYLTDTQVFLDDHLKVDGLFNIRTLFVKMNSSERYKDQRELLDNFSLTLTHELSHKTSWLVKLLATAYEQNWESDPIFADVNIKPLLKEAYEVEIALNNMYDIYRKIYTEVIGEHTIEDYKNNIRVYNYLSTIGTLSLSEEKERKEAKNKLLDIFSKTGLSNSDLYMLTNLEEFKAELLSNPKTSTSVAVFSMKNDSTRILYKKFLNQADRLVNGYDKVLNGMSLFDIQPRVKNILYKMTSLILKIESLTGDPKYPEAVVRKLADRYINKYILNNENQNLSSIDTIPSPDDVRRMFGELTKDGKPKLLAVDTDGSSKNYLIMQKRAIRINQGQSWYEASVKKTTGEGVLRSKEFYYISLKLKENVTLNDVNAISDETTKALEKFC